MIVMTICLSDCLIEPTCMPALNNACQTIFLSQWFKASSWTRKLIETRPESWWVGPPTELVGPSNHMPFNLLSKPFKVSTFLPSDHFIKSITNLSPFHLFTLSPFHTFTFFTIWRPLRKPQIWNQTSNRQQTTGNRQLTTERPVTKLCIGLTYGQEKIYILLSSLPWGTILNKLWQRPWLIFNRFRMAVTSKLLKLFD
jgi:hypothetical protein